MPPYAGDASNAGATFYFGSSSDLLSIQNPHGIAVDGAGNIWVANPSGNLPANLTEVLPSAAATGGYTYFANPNTTAKPLKVAVDNSGNVWVLLNDNTVTEYVGVATPAVTPIALAVNKGKLSAKP